MDKSLDNRIALGRFFYAGTIKQRPFYNTIDVISKGKKRGYVVLQYLDANEEGLYLHKKLVHPDDIGDWL
jgi:hypothetical protein